MTAPQVFIFGHGYSAGHFAARLKPSDIVGTTVRSRDKAASLAAHGLKPFVFDGEHPCDGIASTLYRATHLLVSVPPGHRAPKGAAVGGANAAPGDPVLRWYADEIGHGSPKLEWIGYLSTVGVYGDHEGGWVDEESELRPVSKRSKARVEAEAAWRALAKTRGVPLAILRLSGIYGPGRNGFVNLAKGTAKRLVKPGQVFNRIHVDDIAGALELLAERRLGGVFNVTDDEPAPPQDVVAHAAALAGIEPPPEVPFDEAELSPMARSFYGENKRVSNAKLKAAGYVFRHPTYREALPGLLGDFGRFQEQAG
ncbi:SDR family NAD(P)-dependent oxidoreductase [Aurantimonas sp. VKM B-3413]|uniref:SDR family NAD(P)-dependent oxidoreductase n=1 Tax=Aurantimonas sp. VKM B-3413 TaxID=2779401 RepID=UPI001E5FF2B7|nr:SDR family NAD(P)-dependent oxidoreductase [Aurantimonas sp. VKM B-3413]MCB8840049.1 SDR family NAD(P)-dependent oxidoreductase [Aurantimonas sp. VKM B-3413]